MINPEITQNFLKSLRTSGKIYQVKIKVGQFSVPIDVWPGVFPPQSIYSASSKSVFESFGDLAGLDVADIGCGSGIESIVAILAGARHVDAIDISGDAVACSRQNVHINDLADKITVYQGDLFSNLPIGKRYDLVIANLPIVDFCPDLETDETRALYDPGLELHMRLFTEVPARLASGGIITFTHANLQSSGTDEPDADFERLEALIRDYEFKVIERREGIQIGYKWVNYKITPKL